MAITTLTTNTYEETKPGSLTASISLWQLPKIVWVGTALLLANSAVGIGMMTSNRIQPDVYGLEAESGSISNKPSPFTGIIETNAGKVHVAPKLIPVQFEPASAGADNSAFETLDQ